MSVFHPMKIGMLSETLQGERRIALVPDVAAKLVASGFKVAVEMGAGEQASLWRRRCASSRDPCNNAFGLRVTVL